MPLECPASQKGRTRHMRSSRTAIALNRLRWRPNTATLSQWQRPWASLLPELAKAAPHGSIVDGELVALDSSGRPSFSLIQNPQRVALHSFAFPSTFEAEGTDLTQRPLSQHRASTEVLATTGVVQFSESFGVPAKQMLSWSGVTG